MPDVKVQRKQRTTEMQFRLIIQGAAPIPFQALPQRPAKDIAEGGEIEMKVERHGVVEAEIVVVDSAVVHQRYAKGDRLPALSPDEESDPVGHALPERGKVFLR